jgi:multidrug efflux system membrane fusion protein
MTVWRTLLGATAVLAAVTATGLYFTGLGDKGDGRATAAADPHGFAMPVPIAAVVKKTIPIYLDYSGRTESIRNIVLQAKVSGYLQEQSAPDGADVKAGDLLYKIDSRDFQAALDQVNAQAQRDTAALEYARSNFGRGDQLAKGGWVDKDTFDQRKSAMHQAEAALAIDQAAIHTAQLTLGYAEIRAPFAGRLGRNQAPVGTLVSVAGTVLNTLVQLDPIYVTFNPSESDLVEIEGARSKGTAEASIWLPEATTAHYGGELTFLDNVVDRATGTITARATVANPASALLPGQYVRVHLHIKDEPDALMVPLTALGSSQLGKYVYVVGEGNKAELRLVTLGASDGDLVAVTKGVGENDRVIVGNLQKIGPGSPVQPLPPKAAPGS